MIAIGRRAAGFATLIVTAVGLSSCDDAEDYAVITGFNAELDKSTQGPYKSSQTNSPCSI